jgi:hypothetical protein
VVCEPLANSPSNFASSVTCGVMKSSAPAEVSAEFCGIGAPLTMKLEPGSDSNTALAEGLLTQSCGQATRARKMSGMPPTSVGLSKRPPSSLRTSVAFIAA